MSDFTLDTYNNSANKLVDYFAGIGPRIRDINAAFSYIDRPSHTLRVLELGCGDGRDAVEIAPAVNQYVGVDYSSELIKFANKRSIDNAEFKVVDMKTLDFSEDSKLDIIFAFASMLHLNKAEVAQLFEKSRAALNRGGVWYISLRLRDSYQSEAIEDRFGKRLYYFYNPDEISELAGEGFTEIARDLQHFKGIDWFTVALRKVT